MPLSRQSSTTTSGAAGPQAHGTVGPRLGEHRASEHSAASRAGEHEVPEHVDGLHRLTRAIVTAPTLRETLSALCEGVERVTGVVDLAVSLDEGVPGPAVLLATSRVASRAVGLQRELAAGPHVLAATTGQTCVLPDLVREDRWPRVRAQLATLGLAAAVAVPLGFNGRRLGSVSGYVREPRRFSEQQLRLARRLADVAAADLAYRHHPRRRPASTSAPV